MAAASFESSEIIFDEIVNVYPNPAREYITLRSFAGEKIRFIEVIDVAGVFLRVEVASHNIQLSTSGWRRGLLLIPVATTRALYTKKSG